MYDEQERSNGAGSGMAFIAGLFAGAAVGAGLGLLFAPRKGSELREQISGAATNVGRTVSKTVDDLSQRGATFYEGARGAVARAGDGIERAADTAARSVGDGMNAVRDAAQAVRDKAQKLRQSESHV